MSTFELPTAAQIDARVNRARTWAFASMLGARTIDLVRIAVIARLIGPGQFGIFGIGILVIAVLDAITEGGLRRAVIQRRSHDDRDMHVVWTFGLLRSLVVAAVVLAGAGYIGRFFDEPGSVAIIQTLAGVVILRGLANPRTLLFRKHLEFRRDFAWEFSSVLVGAGVAIFLAAQWANAWALVAGALASESMRTLLSHYLVRPRMALRLRVAGAAELFRFGRWIMAGNVVYLVAMYGDDVAIGRTLGAAALGIYLIAFRWANLATADIAKALGKVTFPWLAGRQHSMTEVASGLATTVRWAAYLMGPIVALLGVLADSVIRTVLGSEWLEAVPVFRVLLVAAFVRGVTDGGVFLSIGRPILNFLKDLTRAGVLLALLWALLPIYGIIGVAFGVLGSLMAGALVWLGAVFIFLPVTLKDMTSWLVGPAAVSVAVALAAWASASVWPHDDFVVLLVGGFTGLLTFAMFTWLAWNWCRAGPAALVLRPDHDL